MADTHTDLNDPFGTNHPGALVIVGLSTLATFGSMAWLHRKNEEAHTHLQAQLDEINGKLTEHIADDRRHLPR